MERAFIEMGAIRYLGTLQYLPVVNWIRGRELYCTRCGARVGAAASRQGVLEYCMHDRPTTNCKEQHCDLFAAVPSVAELKSGESAL